MTKKTFHIITMGCKINQYESEAIREAWLQAGHTEQTSPENADLVLINSCAVTARALSDLRNTARKVRRVAPHCELLITGCAAQALPGELQALPHNGLFGKERKIDLLSYLPAHGERDADEHTPHTINSRPETIRSAIDSVHTPLNTSASSTSPAGFWEHAGPDEIPSPHSQHLFPAFSIKDYARSRAVLKIHDGCSQHCTYCIVPQGRGPSVSRPWAEALAEVSRLLDAGFREIIINGVNLRQYGMDLPGTPDFWDFLMRLEHAFAPEWAPEPSGIQQLRFRISSLEPGQLDNRALDILRHSRLVTPQLHLSLQSGSTRTLRRMGRGHYDPSGLPHFLHALQDAWPVMGLGADFICGFPGETDAEFEETLRLAAALPLTYAHIFPYSARPGTAAAKLPGHLSPEVKKERAARLRALVEEKKQEFLQHQLTLPRLWIAVEEQEQAHGVNEYYTPCRFEDATLLPGRALYPVRPVEVRETHLIVQALPDNGNTEK